MSLVLHFHPLSSYCHKVLIALYEKGIPFEGNLLMPGIPEDAAKLRALWPVAKFPVLEDTETGRKVAESSIIIEYLDQKYPDTLRLVPADGDAALDVRFWDRFIDLYPHTAMQKIVSDGFRPEEARDAHGVADARATIDMAFGMLETRLEGREFLAGDRFSMADCAALPPLFYLSAIVPYADRFPNVQAYFERLCARPSVMRVHTEARPYFNLFPFAAGLDKRFL
ncbi:MAG: glutathione S-transferase family protein [Alphaproteobacteria bacterium]|nr:MAG: glutathione S-transferase family protein [Alphaproteobacteria bacterium]